LPSRSRPNAAAAGEAFAVDLLVVLRLHRPGWVIGAAAVQLTAHPTGGSLWH